MQKSAPEDASESVERTTLKLLLDYLAIARPGSNDKALIVCAEFLIKSGLALGARERGAK